MLSFVRRFRSGLESLPCFILLLGILNGFSAVYISGTNLTPGEICLFSVPGILCAWGILGLRKCCLRFIPATLLAILSSILLISEEKEHFHFREMQNLERLGATVEMRLTDASLCGGRPEWTANAPYYILAEVQSVSVGGVDEKRKYHENVLLTVSFRPEDLERAGYGDLVVAEGYFERIREPVMRGTFDFSAYASARECSLIFHAETFRIIRQDHGLLRKLYDWRSRFLERLTSRMPDGRARDMAPALLFGIRQPIKGEIKNHFLFSGTLHVLSVSGFHIGLFFAAMMIFLCFLPYRIRWFFAPFPVLLYAISTGMQAPAFRAFLMLSLWSFGHVILRKNSNGNTLSAAACVILLLNPFQLFDIGFIYSFLCVLFLILSSDFFRRVSLGITVREEFFQDKRSFSISGLFGKLLIVTGVSLAAWLCSMAVSVSFQSMVSPWAVPAYLLMIPATWFCFLLFLPAILFQWIPGCVELLGEWIAPALEFCAFSAERFGDSGAYYVSPPPVWLSLIFLLSLAGCFVFRERKFFICSAVVLFLTGFFLLFPIPVSEPEIMVIRSESAPVPAVVFTLPASGKAIVWNVPDGDTARLLSDYLKTGGVREIEEVHFDSARSEICGGALFLSSTIEIKSLYFHVPVRKNAKTAQAVLKRFPPPSGRPVLRWMKSENTSEVCPGLAGMEQTIVRMTISEDRGVSLEISHPGQPVLRKEYPYSNEILLERIRLPRQKREAF